MTFELFQGVPPSFTIFKTLLRVLSRLSKSEVPDRTPRRHPGRARFGADKKGRRRRRSSAD